MVPENSSLKGKPLLTAPRASGKSAGAEEEEGALRQCGRLQLGKVYWQTLLGSGHPQFGQLYNGDLVLPPRFPGLGEAATERGQLY